MLLVIDVGNTNITMGVYDGKNLKTTFRMMSKQPRTSDEYGITLRELLRTNEVEKEEIEGVIMASVVPNVMHSLVNGITKYYCRPRGKDRYPCNLRESARNRRRPYCGCGGSL